MRMWMIDPSVLCRQHLLGEHVELHMLVGHLQRGRRLGKLAEKGFVEPTRIASRHRDLVAEISCRGYKHASALEGPLDLDHLDEWEFSATVDPEQSLRDLVARCPECARRMEDPDAE